MYSKFDFVNNRNNDIYKGIDKRYLLSSSARILRVNLGPLEEKDQDFQ